MMDEERRQKIIAEMQKVVESSTPSGDDDSGLSTREWAKVWDVSIKTTRSRLRNFWEAGMIETGKKRIECIDGSMAKIAVYRVKEDTIHKV